MVSTNKYCNKSQKYMALPYPYPTPEKGLYTTSQMLFSTLCTYVRNLHLWHTKTENTHRKEQ